MKKILFYTPFILVLLYLLALGYFNQNSVPLDLMFFRGQYSMALVITVFAFGGFFIGLMTSLFIVKKSLWQDKRRQAKANKVAAAQANPASNDSPVTTAQSDH